eukprot:188463-Hanusia_phi.AAC.4
MLLGFSTSHPCAGALRESIPDAGGEIVSPPCPPYTQHSADLVRRCRLQLLGKAPAASWTVGRLTSLAGVEEVPAQFSSLAVSRGL